MEVNKEDWAVMVALAKKINLRNQHGLFGPGYPVASRQLSNIILNISGEMSGGVPGFRNSKEVK